MEDSCTLWKPVKQIDQDVSTTHAGLYRYSLFSDGAVFTVDLAVQAVLTGHVCNVYCPPQAAGRKVTATEASSEVPVVSTTTNEQGHFCFSLQPGAYSINVSTFQV